MSNISDALDISIKQINHSDALPDGVSIGATRAYGKTRLVVYVDGEMRKEITPPCTRGEAAKRADAIAEFLRYL